MIVCLMKIPLRILALTLLFCQTSFSYGDQPLVSLKAALQPFVDKHEVAGAVMLVANKEKVLATEAVGFADIAANKPMSTDATFWIASMTKPITATAFMMLVDEGKVKLDDPVEKYLPEFKGQMVIAEKDEEHVLLKKPVHPITVRNILSHVSGLAFSSAIEAPTLDMLRLDTVVRSYAAAPLLFEPESKYQYSNEGINTAGRIIEVVSGMGYEEFLQKRLLNPLGMVDTTFWPSEAQVVRLAKTYKPNANKDNLEETQTGFLHYPLTDPARRAMPGGGLFSNAQDVARFGQLILNGGVHEGKRLISEESIRLMTSRQTPATLKETYGLGWAVPNGMYGHGGALATDLLIDPNTGLIAIYLVQHTGFPGEGKTALGKFHEAAVKLFGKKP